MLFLLTTSNLRFGVKLKMSLITEGAKIEQHAHRSVNLFLCFY